MEKSLHILYQFYIYSQLGKTQAIVFQCHFDLIVNAVD